MGYQIINTDFYNYYGNLRLAYALRIRNNLKLADKIVLNMLAIYPIDTLFLSASGILQYLKKYMGITLKALQYILIYDPEKIIANEYISCIENNPDVCV